MRLVLCAIGLGLSICAVGFCEEPSKPTAAVEKWEYKAIEVKGSSKPEDLTATMNGEGEQGWELVGVVAGKDTDQNKLLFKRKKDVAQAVVGTVSDSGLSFAREPDTDLVLVRSTKTKKVAVLENVKVEAIPELDIVILKGKNESVQVALTHIEKVKAAAK